MLPLQNLCSVIEHYSASLMNAYILQDVLVQILSDSDNDNIGKDHVASTDNEWLTLIPMLTRLMVMTSMYRTPIGKNSLMNMAILEIAIGNDE